MIMKIHLNAKMYLRFYPKFHKHPNKCTWLQKIMFNEKCYYNNNVTATSGTYGAWYQ